MSKRLEGLLGFYERDPEDPFVLYGLALEYLSENKNQETESFFYQAVEKNPYYVSG